jgi:hypothetical protein
MSKLESVSQLNQLLQQDVSQVQDWLKNVWSGKQKAPENFNWLGLAEAATSVAYSDYANNIKAPNIYWAEVATFIYDQLSNGANLQKQDAYMLSSMALRAAMIEIFGEISGHPVLDLDRVINWFLDNLPMSYKEAETKAASWSKCPVEDIRELRRIKNRLNIISVLAESKKCVLNEELNTWLSLRHKLP